MGRKKLSRRRFIKQTTVIGAAISITNIKKIKYYIDGGNTLGYIMDKFKSIDIDELQDFILAEIIQKKFKFNY